MNAKDLAALLLAQATPAPHQIRLNDATLGTTGLDALVTTDLRRNDGTLLLVVDPSTIPTDPPAAGFTLAASVPAGDCGFLALDARDASVQFVVDGGAALLLTVQTRLSGGKLVDWVFSDSFRELANLPYDSLDLVGPELELSTGVPAAPKAGLYFDGTLVLTGLFATIASFVGVTQRPLLGALARTSTGLSFDLSADLGVATKSLGTVLTLDDLCVGVALTPVTDPDGTTERLVQFYLGATVKFTGSGRAGRPGKTLDFDTRALVPVNAPGAQMMLFTVQPVAGFTASLDSLGSLVGGQTWNHFFDGPASGLKPYFASFGLKGYSMSFALASASVTRISIDVGTLSPWTMWNGYTLSLDASWHILYLGGRQTVSTLTLTAEFDFKTLSFDVVVIVPDLTITGTQRGAPITYSLEKLNADVFDGKLQLPPGLLSVEVSDFNIGIDVSPKQFSIGATVTASVAPFGTPLLGIHDMVVAVNVNASAPTNVYTATLNGQVSLGPIVVQADATIGNMPGNETVFALHLVDETVGSMLNHLVHLVDPDFDISFGDPWDKLLDVPLDALVLQVNLTKGTVSLSYDAPLIDLGFITITQVSLIYTQAQAGQSSAVQIELEGTFLGKPNMALGWDAINDSPPSIPGAGAALFDLEYVGLGQHIGFGTQPATMKAVINALRASVLPTQPGQLPAFGKGGLEFQAQSHWLIGAQFSIMDTVAISAVFNDPNLYGILISLTGEKAGAFAGLEFEILYRKITDSIGVYHIELKLPDAMRHLEFGEVSVTLPVVVLDVYTNGNFRIDLGFPKGLDFSNSFSVQVFPFVGFGGLYLALLDGATSARVPCITNGTWSPVIELGVALSLGVGKTIDEGMLSGGISVTVIGIVQGVLAWFHPTTNAPKGTYYSLQGTIAIVGRLYATIDFTIIQASVDVTAYASVTLTIEAHVPIYIELSAGVSVRVGVKIVFFTIHLSFSTTIKASFTIGHASATPWQLAPGSGGSPNAIRQRLRGQRTLHATTPRYAGLRAALSQAAVPRSDALVSWPAVRVLPQGVQTIAIWAIPGFSKPDTWNLVSLTRASGSITATTVTAHDLMPGDTVVIAGAADGSFDGPFAVIATPDTTSFTVIQTGEPDAPTTGGTATMASSATDAEAVLLLAAENSVSPSATTLASHRLLAGPDPASAPFNLLLQAMLAWGIYVETTWTVAAVPVGAVRSGGTVTVATTAAHRLMIGDTVVLAGVADASFDGAFTVAAVPDPSTFTVDQPAAPDAQSGGGTARYALAVPVGTAPGSISRVGGATTVTTDAPHGLRTGDAAVLAGVADGSFDGTFTVASVVDMVTFTIDRPDTPDAASNGGFVAVPGVSAAQFADLRMQLGDADTVSAAFDYGTLTAFLAANFVFDVTPSASASEKKGVALFPMIPAVQLTDTVGTSVNFATATPVDATYQAKVRAYFQLLQAQFHARNGGSTSTRKVTDDTASMATVVFSRYFNMLMSAGVKAAVDLLAQYPYLCLAPSSIADLGLALGDAGLATDPLRVVLPNETKPVLNPGALFSLPDVVHQIRSGESFATVAAALAQAGAQGAGGEPYAAADLLVANIDATGIFTVGVPVSFPSLAYTTQAADTLNGIAVRILLRAQGVSRLNALVGLQTMVDKIQALNPAKPILAGTTLVLPGDASYTTVAGDTLTWVAGYVVAMAQGAFDLRTFVAALLKGNPGITVIDPTASQPTGLAMTMPPVTRSLAAGDTIDSLATTLLTTTAEVGTALLAVPSTVALLSPLGVLRAPLAYPATSTDTFAGIAAAFDVPIRDIAESAVGAGEVFAAGSLVTVSTLGAVRVGTLMTALLEQGEWNNVSGMVSRFLLGGLRIPDPNDPAFQQLTVEELLDPTKLAGIVTRPMFALTRQQFPIAVPAPPGYAITLANGAGVPWLTFSGSSSATFALTTEQQQMLSDVASTSLGAAGVAGATRLALYQMVPPRIALQNHIAWQAAALPGGCLSAGGAAGNPSVWLFPDTLVQQINAAAAGTTVPLLYELVTARHTDPEQPVTVAEASCYAWATLVNVTVSRPATDGAAPGAANACVIDGADDAGAALLQQLYAYLAPGTDTATLYLLYRPDPAGGNAAGLATDVLDAGATFVLKTNLSTLTHSGGMRLDELAASDPTSVQAASVADVPDFLALLWEASVTRSGGFYLNYVNAAGGATLPASVFGTGSTATLALLVVLTSQTTSKDVALHPFTNCVVVSDNIDTSVTTVFVQPATYTVRPDDSLATAASAFNVAWGTSLTALQFATPNAGVPLLLLQGAALTLPSGATYEVSYGDTLASIVAANGIADLATLIGAGSNTTASILSAGAQMQIATGTLRPAATAPPGTVGFEVTRANPDPKNLPFSQLTPAQVVGSMFNLVGWQTEGSATFLPSGAGLPTTPADSLQARTDGLTQRSVDDEVATEWYYQQTLSVSPFARIHAGSASAALPPAAADPYAGIGYDTSAQRINTVAVDLDLQDIYGNIQPFPAGLTPVSVPVGYFDDVVGLASWPSLAVSYTVAGTLPTITLALSMQQSRYMPSPGAAVDTALASIAADMQSYTRIVYQLAQPDLSFSLTTTLDADSMTASSPTYPLAATPFASFARGAYVYLAARATMTAVRATASDGTMQQIAGAYGVTLGQLLVANQNQRYAALFGTTLLQVPAMYAVIQGDTLAAIAAQTAGLTVPALATTNAAVPLQAGTELASPSRPVTATAADSLATLGQPDHDAHASAAAIALANASIPGLLQQGRTLTVGTTSYVLAANDTFDHAAAQLGTTVDVLADANQWVTGLFVGGAVLAVDTVLATDGDTLQALATDAGTAVETLATMNADLPNVWPVATSVQVGPDTSPVPPADGDSLAAFAAANRVTVQQLGTANAAGSTPLAAGGSIIVPGVLANEAAAQYCTYTTTGSDTVGGIATRFAIKPADVVALNPDIPGLLAGGQTIVDSASGNSVPTQADDTFQSIVARFGAAGVTISLAALAVDVALQTALVVPSSLWLCPPMLGGGGGSNPYGTLAGLAKAYNTDVSTLASANAAILGVLAPNVTLPLGDPAIKTGVSDTLNSVVSRLAQRGTQVTVTDVAAALENVAGLVEPTALIAPVPPPSPEGLAVTLQPKFASATFQMAVNVVMARDPRLVDPDFAGAPTVATAVSAVVPEPDAGVTLRFTDFATALQTALPGVQVATGPPEAEGDQASAATFWCVNFANSAGPPITYGPQITYQFHGAGTDYFAIPPLSTSLVGGTVSITPYASGTGLSGTPQARTFQAIDLEVWLNTFLQAVDQFLAPAYAVPAYAIDPAVSIDDKAVVQVVTHKKSLAAALSQRVQPIVAPCNGSLSDAQAAMYQALLSQLSAAFTVNALVQVPVTASGGGSNPLAAPRLSGKLTAAGTGSTDVPSTFSFSSAKVALLDSGATATFLFTAKSPAQHREAQLDVDYTVTELELPDPSSVIGDYEGSTWLTFIEPLSDARSVVGHIVVPIALRSYPSPTQLVVQGARQSVEAPESAADLLGWDFGFVYQHDDAEQDTPIVVIGFNGAPGGPLAVARAGDPLDAVFATLAQFMAVYPALKNDLALLPLASPTMATATPLAAAQAFAQLVGGVAAAFTPSAAAMLDAQPPEAYAYQIQKDPDKSGNLEKLTVTFVDPTTGLPVTNSLGLWPTVHVTISDTEVELSRSVSTATQAVYAYPAAIPAYAALTQRFVFPWPGGTIDSGWAGVWPIVPGSVTLSAPQTYVFTGVNPLARQTAMAGVSIARNLSLIHGKTTNPAFIYRTPLTRFTSSAMPSVLAAAPIAIGAAPTTGVAESLGTFLKALLTSQNNWQPGDTVSIRLSAGYAYSVAGALDVVVPMVLVPAFNFNPTADWDSTVGTSFVSQVASAIAAWKPAASLTAPDASYRFEVTIYADRGLLQPLIRATSLRYMLALTSR